jgi:carbonic anhydrase
VDKASTGIISIAKYSAPATTGLDSEGVVETKCIEVPKFEGIDTLAFFATESIQNDAKIEDLGTTFLNSITVKDEAMYLYDETKKGKAYVPLQFHYHAPSEHTIDGYSYDLELHIVHKNDSA